MLKDKGLTENRANMLSDLFKAHGVAGKVLATLPFRKQLKLKRVKIAIPGIRSYP